MSEKFGIGKCVKNMTQFTYVWYGIILVHVYFACRIDCVLS